MVEKYIKLDAPKPLRVLITAAGTVEKIDDVRTIALSDSVGVMSNRSSGRLGAACARAMADRGCEVTLLAGRSLTGHPERIDSRVRVVPFDSFVDLDIALQREITTERPDLLFMTAAVSDFSPVAVTGKISSQVDELQLTLKRNSKLLAKLRQLCGVETFLVGFKLLAHVSQDDLVSVAHRQIKDNRLNLCFANDFAELNSGQHPGWLVTPEGGAIHVTGTKQETAEQLSDFVLKRHRVRWHRSIQATGLPVVDDAHSDALALLRFAIEGNLLPGTDGNVSHRTGDSLWATPRQAVKAALGPHDLVKALVNPETRTVTWTGRKKPSIDTGVHAWLYRHLPNLGGLIHFHDALVLPNAETNFPWPCGTVEEAEEVHTVLTDAARRGRWDGQGFSVKLVDHGYLVGVPNGGAQKLWARWQETHEGYLAHLRDVGAGGEHPVCTPMLDGGLVVGVAAHYNKCAMSAWSIWLRPDTRGTGRGDRVVEMLSRQKRHAVVHDACCVEKWYVAHGWLSIARDGKLSVLQPPSLRTDLISSRILTEVP